MITHAVIFAPIGQANRSDQIVQRLSNAIITGLLEPHEQLPNEADLAKMMGVSHITIREAFNTLRANHLIHTVRGRNGGSFVCERAQDSSHRLHPFKSISTDYISDLGEMHCAVIGHCARLACQRMTTADIDNLRGFVDVFSSAMSSELKTQADMRCLLAIAANSHSARLASQELLLQAEWATLVAILYQSESIHREVIGFYTAFIDSLAAQDETESVRIATQLINTLTLHLIESKLKYI